MPTGHRPRPRPRVIAHRGASEDAPEHTLTAYVAALQGGADGLECDVRLTRDGVPVCIHDRRVDRTLNGRGVVSTLHLADLADLTALDPLTAFAPPAPGTGSSSGLGEAVREEPDRDGRRVLTLQRLLETVLDHGRPIELAVETKHPTRYAGQVERRVVDLLRRYGLHESPAPGAARRTSARLMSFSPTALARAKLLAPRLGTVQLLKRLPRQLSAESAPLAPAHAVGPRVQFLHRHPAYVEQAHARGHQVYAWTVNTAADLQLCLQLGVDAVITDRPRQVRQQLA